MMFVESALFPRRACLDKMTPAERAIYDAMLAVEALPPNLLLTDAVTLLLNARNRVADYVEEELEKVLSEPDDDHVYQQIEEERDYQDQRWGHNADDTLNTPWMWTAYINHYSSKWMAGAFLPLEEDVVDDFRAMMIKTAALCVAAVESVDRQRDENGKTFYEA